MLHWQSVAMQSTIGPVLARRANDEIKEYLTQDATANERGEQASRRICTVFDGLAKGFQLEGEIKTFGSFSNGCSPGKAS